MLGKIKFS